MPQAGAQARRPVRTDCGSIPPRADIPLNARQLTMTTARTPTLIPVEEEHRNAYFYFVEALATLAADAETQCELIGDYNVAWELKNDVAAGQFLADWDLLTAQQRSDIRTLVSALSVIPEEILRAAQGRSDNLAAMNAPAWATLRVKSRKLLLELQSFSEANRLWLNKRA